MGGAGPVRLAAGAAGSLDDAELASPPRSIAAVGDTELGEDRGDVVADCLLR